MLLSESGEGYYRDQPPFASSLRSAFHTCYWLMDTREYACRTSTPKHPMTDVLCTQPPSGLFHRGHLGSNIKPLSDAPLMFPRPRLHPLGHPAFTASLVATMAASCSGLHVGVLTLPPPQRWKAVMVLRCRRFISLLPFLSGRRISLSDESVSWKRWITHSAERFTF